MIGILYEYSQQSLKTRKVIWFELPKEMKEEKSFLKLEMFQLECECWEKDPEIHLFTHRDQVFEPI